jgi:hypothetical protein
LLFRAKEDAGCWIEKLSAPELLDLCSPMLEDFTKLKATIQDLQVALRKGDEATFSVKIQSGKKHFKKTVTKVTSDKEDYRMVMQLSEAKEIAPSLLESTLHLLSKQIVMPRWSLVSKAFQTKNPVGCKEEQLQVQECSIRDLEVGA